MHLPGPIPYALQTVRLPFLYTVLEIKLTPAIFTFKGGAGSCAGMHNETSTPGTPPSDWSVYHFLGSLDVRTLIKVDFHV